MATRLVTLMKSFPTTPTWQSRPSKATRREDGTYVWVNTSTEDHRSLSDAVDRAQQGARNTFLPQSSFPSHTHFGSYIISQDGIIEAKTVSFNRPRVTVSNSNFTKKVRAGKIVVANYDSDVNVSITANPKIISSSVQTSGNLPRDLHRSGLFTFVQDPTGLNRKNCYTFNGVIYSGGVLYCPWERVLQSFDGSFGDYSFDLHLEDILNRIDSLPIDGGMITSVVSEANQGSFDVMMALAELPETFISIFDGCCTIVKMYNEARAKDIRIQNKLSRLRRIEEPNAATRKAISDLLSASADIWLTYRLGIYPFSKMIEELIELHFGGVSLFQRFRDTNNALNLDVSYGDEECLIPVTSRAFIKRRYRSPIESFGFSNLGAAWELIPLSFVLDRYVSIGDYIVAHTTPDLSIDEGATYSWKVSGSNGALWNNEIQYSVDVSFYKRKVINPIAYCGLNYPVKRTKAQTADHLALIWNILLDQFVRPNKTRKY